MIRRRFSSGEVEFNPDKYLTIEALEDGLSITSKKIIYYRTIESKWMSLGQNIQTPQINKGECLYIKAKWEDRVDIDNVFDISKKCKLKGNCMSLFFWDSADKNNDLSAYPYAFYCLFRDNTTIIEVSPTFLPATTLSDNCYFGMFWGCESLTTAPALPATELTESCYYYMFQGCTNLNYIKMLATDISASSCLCDWVSGVASTGTFVKNNDATWDVVGNSGVPEGWTVITDDQEQKTVNNVTMTIASGGLLRPLTVTMDYPAASLLKLEYSTDGGITWKEHGAIIPIGYTTFLNTASHLLYDSIQYRLNPSEDDVYIYQFTVVE